MWKGCGPSMAFWDIPQRGNKGLLEPSPQSQQWQIGLGACPKLCGQFSHRYFLKRLQSL
jgi:hypothetical protein